MVVVEPWREQEGDWQEGGREKQERSEDREREGPGEGLDILPVKLGRTFCAALPLLRCQGAVLFWHQYIATCRIPRCVGSAAPIWDTHLAANHGSRSSMWEGCRFCAADTIAIANRGCGCSIWRECEAVCFRTF